MKFFRVIAADDHCESILEAERLGDFEVEAVGVELLDAVIDGGGITLRGFAEDGGERRAGVLDVEVELAGEERFVDEECAAKIGLSDDGNAGFSFDVLGQEFGEHNLLGEKFRTNRDFGLRGFAARGKEAYEVKETKEAEEWELDAAHFRRLSVYARRARAGNLLGAQGEPQGWRRQG